VSGLGGFFLGLRESIHVFGGDAAPLGHLRDDSGAYLALKLATLVGTVF
jgi:hypothetical protein